MNDWLQKLKVGDEVWMQHSGWKELEKVEKLTATQIVVQGQRYRKTNGRNCGDEYLGSISEVTAMNKAEHETHLRNERLKNWAYGFSFSNLTINQLERIKVIAEEKGGES